MAGPPITNSRASIRASMRASMRPSGNSSATSNTAAPRRNPQPAAGPDESNINVFVRCRGRNDREVQENSAVVVSTTGINGKEITLQTGNASGQSKTYTFDGVFGPESDQTMLYDGVAANVLTEMLQGYNCTIFAYGQTGTGKTYTMSGDMSELAGSGDQLGADCCKIDGNIAGISSISSNSPSHLSEKAGIIPRILFHLFRQLGSSTPNASEPEYDVKISFIELYNEELRDLLAGPEDRRVRIYDDTSATKRGITVQGMEEVHIRTAAEGLQLLRHGSRKRQVAATQCNDLSSRSHSVFTITAYIREPSPSGDDVLRVGKLNLVDLAGSENIGRSGAEHRRAREAGMINQSLLTLGRVINALVDRAPHIPYRESKLTRLLQDSLGGGTKTCIVATVSPARAALDETLSTLEYASRAKNIRNRPTANASVAKAALVKEYVAQLARLRSELASARAKDGVYLPTEAHEALIAESESRRVEASEARLRVEALEAQLRRAAVEREAQVKEMEVAQQVAETAAREAQQKAQLLEQEAEKAQQEAQVLKRDKDLLQTQLQTISDIVTQLQSRVAHKAEIEQENFQNWSVAQLNVAQLAEEATKAVESATAEATQFHNSHSNAVATFISGHNAATAAAQQRIRQAATAFQTRLTHLEAQLAESGNKITTCATGIDSVKQAVRTGIAAELAALSAAADGLAATAEEQIDAVRAEVQLAFNQIGKQFKTVVASCQEAVAQQMVSADELRAALAASAAENRRLVRRHAENAAGAAEAEKQATEAEKQRLLASVAEAIEAFCVSKNSRVAEGHRNVAQGFSEIDARVGNTAEEAGAAVGRWLNDAQTHGTELAAAKARLKEDLVAAHGHLDTCLAEMRAAAGRGRGEAVAQIEAQINGLEAKMGSLEEFSVALQAENVAGVARLQGEVAQLRHLVAEESESSVAEVASVENTATEFAEKAETLVSQFKSVYTGYATEAATAISNGAEKVAQHTLKRDTEAPVDVKMLSNEAPVAQNLETRQESTEEIEMTEAANSVESAESAKYAEKRESTENAESCATIAAPRPPLMPIEVTNTLIPAETDKPLSRKRAGSFTGSVKRSRV